MKTTMDNYVIRVYRRDVDDPSKMVGEVEQVEDNTTEAFQDVSELFRILVDPKGDPESGTALPVPKNKNSDEIDG